MCAVLPGGVGHGASTLSGPGAPRPPELTTWPRVLCVNEIGPYARACVYLSALSSYIRRPDMQSSCHRGPGSRLLVWFFLQTAGREGTACRGSGWRLVGSLPGSAGSPGLLARWQSLTWVCVPVSVRMVGRSLSELLVWVGVFYKVKPSMGHQRHPPPTRFMSAVGVTSWVTLGWLPESLGPCINENPPSSVASAGLSPQGPQTAQSLLEVTEQGQIMDSAVKGPGSKSLLCHFLPE